MSAEIVFPDPRTVVISRLLDRLPVHGWDAPVSSDVPDPRPALFVTVAAGGGRQLNEVADDPTVIVEAWASSDTEANDLIRSCRSIVQAMRGTVEGDVAVYRVVMFADPISLPDLSGQPRWTFTASVAMRGSAPVFTD